jgi:predicted RNA-binding Zn ribbon-like protein
MKTPTRTRSVGTKVSDEEYARLEACASEKGLSISEWSREALLAAANGVQSSPAERTLLAEVIALRTIVANVVFAFSSEGKVSSEQMHAFIERADKTKAKRALDLLSKGGSAGKPKGGSEPQSGEGAP